MFSSRNSGEHLVSVPNPCWNRLSLVPLNLWSDEKPNLFRLAAAYTHGIVKNHPFVDGKKRTGYVICGIFLQRNGQNLNASEEEASAAIIALASHALTEDDFVHWIQANCP